MDNRDCSFSGCGKPARRHGLCEGHDAQQRKGKELTPLRARRPKGPGDLHRDDQGRKLCLKCQLYRDEGDFYQDASRKDRLTIYCADCCRARHLLRMYGLTEAAYAQLLADQGGHCATCPQQPEAGTLLQVDHDHSCCAGEASCGKCVRSLLCGPCNKVLGMVQDDAGRLRALADYVDSFS